MRIEASCLIISRNALGINNRAYHRLCNQLTEYFTCDTYLEAQRQNS